MRSPASSARLVSCLRKHSAIAIPGSLELLVEIACRAGDVDSAGNAALTVLDALHDARRLAALGTVRALGRVHYLLAICGLCNLRHDSPLTPQNLIPARNFGPRLCGLNPATLPIN